MKLHMNNRQVAEAFAEGRTEAIGSNLFIEGPAVYSYGHHFPIAVRTEATHNGRPIVLFNSDGYSMTTAKHKSYIRGELYNTMVIEADTNTLQGYITLLGWSGSDYRGKLSDIDKELDARLDRAEEHKAKARTESSRERWAGEVDRITDMLEALQSLTKYHMQQTINPPSEYPL